MAWGAASRCLRNVEAGEVKSPEGKRDFKNLEDKREVSLSRKKLDKRMEEYERRGAEALGTEGTLREVPEMQPMPNGPVMREGNIDRGEEDGYDEIGGISETKNSSANTLEINNLINFIKENNGTPPQGYKGGKIYKNEPLEGMQKLPEGVNYREYDIYPYIKGQNRGKERIVIGDDGSVWYTDDHYQTFTKLE